MSELCPICSNPLEANASACPACGFKLLGATQSFTPLTIMGDEVLPTPKKQSTSAILRIVRGPQIETVFRLSNQAVTIGRSPHCDVFLNDMTVSRDHAVIEPTDNGYQIRDLASYNGVWINNKSIESSLLQDKDIVQIGAFCLLYQINPTEGVS